MYDPKGDGDHSRRALVHASGYPFATGSGEHTRLAGRSGARAAAGGWEPRRDAGPRTLEARPRQEQEGRHAPGRRRVGPAAFQPAEEPVAKLKPDRAPALG